MKYVKWIVSVSLILLGVLSLIKLVAYDLAMHWYYGRLQP